MRGLEVNYIVLIAHFIPCLLDSSADTGKHHAWLGEAQRNPADPGIASGE